MFELLDLLFKLYNYRAFVFDVVTKDCEVFITNGFLWQRTTYEFKVVNCTVVP